MNSGLNFAIDKSAPHLGGSVIGGDPYTWSPSCWRYVVERFCVRSVLDLGSGCGNAADWFFRAGCAVVAVDGLPENIVGAAYPTVLHDLTKAPFRTRVNLVHCQEVVEHVEEAFLDNLLESLMCGRIILMTHAVPGQGGYHHVNLQPSEYWIGHLTRRGCSLLEADTARVRELARKDDAAHMAATGLVFAHT